MGVYRGASREQAEGHSRLAFFILLAYPVGKFDFMHFLETTYQSQYLLYLVSKYQECITSV